MFNGSRFNRDGNNSKHQSNIYVYNALIPQIQPARVSCQKLSQLRRNLCNVNDLDS